MLLPWGDETVISHVIATFREAGLDDILVVTGGARERVEDTISHLEVKAVYNEQFSNGEMLSSVQCGIRALKPQTKAMLIGLGDQPQVQAGSVKAVCDAYLDMQSKIIVPSYQIRRGHPWLVVRPLWDDLLKMRSPSSPRDFLHTHRKNIQYVNVNDPGILADLDTPEDYQRCQP